MLKTKTKNKMTLLTVITVIVVLINSGYYRTTVSNSYIPLALAIAVAAVYLFFPANYKHRFPLNFYLIILIAGIGLSLLWNFSFSNLLSGGRVAVTLVCAYIIAVRIDFHAFMRGYNTVVSIIVVFAAVLYAALAIFGDLPLPTLIGDGGVYYDLIIVTQNIGTNRACGIFWEPGVLATILVIAFIFEIYFKERVSLLNLFLYMVGIYLTKSTAGYLILFLLLVGYVWKRTMLSRFKIANVVFVVALTVFSLYYKTFFYWLSGLIPDVFNKLVETGSLTTMTRINAPYINFNMFLSRPLFGWGFTGAASLFKLRLSSFINPQVVAQTSTSTQMLASIGIAGAAYTIGFIALLWNKVFEGRLFFVDKFIVIVCLLLLVNKEPHIYFLITWMVFFYFSTPHSNENLRRRSHFVRGSRKNEEEEDDDDALESQETSVDMQ